MDLYISYGMSERMEGSAGKKKNVNPGQINVCSK